MLSCLITKAHHVSAIIYYTHTRSNNKDNILPWKSSLEFHKLNKQFEEEGEDRNSKKGGGTQVNETNF